MKENELKNSLLGKIKLEEIKLEPTNLQKTKLQNEVEKKELIDRFFSIGSNMYLEKLIELELDLGKFHAKTNDEDIRKLLTVLEIFRINTRSKEIYTLSEDFNKLFVEMYNNNNMTFFEVRISSLLFMASDEPEEIFAVTDHLIRNIEKHANEHDYIRAKFFIYQNSADMLMYIRRKFDTYQKNEFDSKLIEYLINAVALSKQFGNKYWSAVVTLNLGLILQNDIIINASIQEIKLLNDKDVDTHIKFVLSSYDIEY